MRLCTAMIVATTWLPFLSAGSQKPALPAFNKVTEKIALGFVNEHYPELAQVLDRLAKVNPPQYQQAIREICQEAIKINRWKNSDLTLYEFQLEGWKVKTQIELLAAKIACAKEPDQKLIEELKQLLYRQNDLQAATMQYNRDLLLKRANTLEMGIKHLTDNRNQIVERRLKALTFRKQAPAKSKTSADSGPKPKEKR
ncbi:MAG: hypothetical protein KatS3mg105_2666 [Gemmatales bacterium]|nr:MAG: hypothetical protein KatS3mg105_2666 [Gemmatales bacterium]